MIIALSGLAGCGKDTTGRAIQYTFARQETENPAVLKALERQGIDEQYNYDRMSGWSIMKFATKVKQIASMLTGISVEKFESQSFKQLPLPRQWDVFCVELEDGQQMGCFNSEADAKVWEDEYKENHVFRTPLRTSVVRRAMTVREFLQRLGTDAMRYGLHPDVWVNGLFSEYTDESRWIITDCRFENEALAIKERGGIIVRVNRPQVEPVGELHVSETALNNWKFDYEIVNDGDIGQLISKVEVMLNEIGYNLSVE